MIIQEKYQGSFIAFLEFHEAKAKESKVKI